MFDDHPHNHSTSHEPDADARIPIDALDSGTMIGAVAVVGVPHATPVSVVMPFSVHVPVPLTHLMTASVAPVGGLNALNAADSTTVSRLPASPTTSAIVDSVRSRCTSRVPSLHVVSRTIVAAVASTHPT